MGRGKTSAAEAYMNSSKEGRFLYITPYLNEVDRICDDCEFVQPDGRTMTKRGELKMLLRAGKNVASTHALFYLMNDDIFKIVNQKKYTLIIDEELNMISKVNATSDDMELIFEKYAEVDSEGFVHWIDDSYSGIFNEYRELAESGSLYKLDTALLRILSPNMIRSFSNVIMMTYLFGGQYQKAYLDFFGFKYKICGIDDSNGFQFTDAPDSPPPMDYRRLINLVDTEDFMIRGAKALRETCSSKYALSKSWYDKRKRDNKDIKQLRSSLRSFFSKYCESRNELLWTCFKSDRYKLVDKNGSYMSSYLQMSARATNEYRERTAVAYYVNRFADPNVTKFFAQRGITIDQNQFALGEMLQFIWRSAIRDDREITLYIPSKRMKDLLIEWINENSISDGDNKEDNT